MSARPTRRPGLAALVAVLTAVALLAALAWVVTLELPRPRSLLAVLPIPREGLGVAWSERAVWPVEMQAAAVERAAWLLTALVLAGVTIAALNGLVLLAEGSAARRHELAVRAALGGAPRRLLADLLRELRGLVAAGAVLGLGVGTGVGALARLTWPGAPGPVGLAGQAFALLAVAALLAAAFAGAHALYGARTGRTGALADTLRSGERLTADPRAIFVRRVLPAVQIAVAGAVLVSAAALGSAARSDSSPGAEARNAAPVLVVPAVASGPDAWPALMDRLSELPGLEAESLATPGTLVGLGVRDLVVAECGRCVRGMIPMPMVSATVDHHAVGPGYFAATGLEVLSGREFSARDRAGADRVAVVNRTFALSSFENGQLIGKRVRVGRTHDTWYTVVGVVADRSWPVLGSADRPREAIFLSALQRPPRSADVVLRGTADAVAAAHRAMLDQGVTPAEARPLDDVRRRAAAPLAWIRWIALAVAGLALLMAAHGVHTTALQVGRRRARELAVRRALGATGRDVVGHVLGERLRLTGWGLAGMTFLGTLAVALLRKAAGGILPPGPGTYVAVGVGLGLVAVAASAQAALHAVRVEPSVAMAD